MEPISKIVNLIKKTGDKAIILDANGDPSYVVMTVSDYERLILGKSEIKGLTEDELLDKINRDIEIWKESSDEGNLPIDQHDFSQDLVKNANIEANVEFNSIPNPVSIDDFSLNLEENNDSEEDRYYFEPVE